MTDIQGYVQLKKDANCEFAFSSPLLWQRQILRAMEINKDTESVLLLSSDATKLGMFDLKDCESWFECDFYNRVLIPKGLSQIQRFEEFIKRKHRKGGYEETIRNMVIVNSLQKGKFDDDFLFQKT